MVNLAGAGIADRRWSAERKALLLRSREAGTTLLATTLAGLAHPPPVLLSGSAIGYYGDRGDEVLTESSEPGRGFLPDLCRAWEAATRPAEDAGIRVVHLRTGLVLAPKGGMLRRMVPLFRLALGGRLGRGRQYWPWVALDDEVGAIRWLLDHDVRGPVNLTGPRPVTNAEFTRSLGEAVHRPAVLPGATVRARSSCSGGSWRRSCCSPPLGSSPRRWRRPATASVTPTSNRPCGPRSALQASVRTTPPDAQGDDYFGGMRIPPSMRTVSPFM